MAHDVDHGRDQTQKRGNRRGDAMAAKRCDDGGAMVGCYGGKQRLNT